MVDFSDNNKRIASEADSEAGGFKLSLGSEDIVRDRAHTVRVRRTFFDVSMTERLLSLINFLALTIFCALFALYLLQKGYQVADEINAISDSMSEKRILNGTIQDGEEIPDETNKTVIPKTSATKK